MKSPFQIVLLAAYLLVVTHTLHAVPPKQSAPAAPVWTETETWVIKQVQSGKTADLGEQFPTTEAKRVLSARFLENLLTGTIPEFKPHRNGVRINAAIFDEAINLDDSEIIPLTALEKCEFRQSLSFTRTRFAQSISLLASTFRGDANFNGMKGGGSVFLDKAVFAGAVNFVYAAIDRNLEANEAQFQSEEQAADFSSMKVGDTVFLDKAVFAGAAIFSNTAIVGQFSARKTQFQSEEQPANFSGMKVGDSVFLDKAVFAGAVNFRSVTIDSTFEANEAQFQSEEQAADFNSMKVGDTVFLDKAVFAGPANFHYAVILRHFSAKQTQFRSKEQPAKFIGLNVGGIAAFTRAVFAGSADFSDAFFLDLHLREINPKLTPLTLLDLSRTSIKRELAITLVQIKELKAQMLHVEGPTSLTSLWVDTSADLRNGNFSTLDLSGSLWPSKESKALQLQGTNYKYLGVAKDEPTSHAALLELANRAAYTADVYGNLEAFFTRQGYRDDADRVFIAGKCRERDEHLPRFSLDHLGSWVFWTIGYGRHPWRALIPCALIVGLGCLLFTPAQMELQKPSESSSRRIYNRFWYSLELFLPFVKLQSEDAWRPKSEYRFLCNYMRVHTLLGWILIPIALAAISGLLK